MFSDLRVTTSQTDIDSLLGLPWDTPLVSWPSEISPVLPRGISRHIVRFVHLGERIIAIKEIGEHRAFHEYEMLTQLKKRNAASVEPLAVITGRQDPEGNPLDPAIVTEHLPFSLPYRALFRQRQGTVPVDRLIDALAVLMVRLHLIGFFWGDVSLSNTLFRRDAGEFAAYLVDAETGEIFDSITEGKRLYDVDVARTNIIGELMDLQAAGRLPDDFDTITVGDRLESRYNELWEALTGDAVFESGQRWQVTEHIQKLNELGFEVGRLEIVEEADGAYVRIQPKVVDAGHYSRQIARLTGLKVEENQGRRLLNDLNEYRLSRGLQDMPMPVVARHWLTNAFQPTVDAVPRDLRGKLPPAELYHQFLDHRWYISEQAGADIPWTAAVTSFINNVLQHQRDELSYIITALPDEFSAESASAISSESASEISADSAPAISAESAPAVSAASPHTVSAATPPAVSAASPPTPGDLPEFADETPPA